MKCLVVGGTAFIGKHLVNYIRNQGDTVTIYSRKLPKNEMPSEGITFIQGSLDDREKLFAAAKDIDVVYHLAWGTFPGTSIRNPGKDVMSNVLGSINLLDACVENNVHRIVFSSSGGTVYGKPIYLPIDESHFTNPISSYGITKLTIEKYIKMYGCLYDLKYAILRMSNAYGEGQLPYRGQGIIPTFLARIYEGKPLIIFGDGSVVRDYIYVKDVAKAFYMAAYGSLPNCTYNVGSGQGINISDLIDRIKAVTGNDITVKYEQNRSFDVPKVILDCELIKSEIGWNADVNLDEGIKRTWKWVQSYMKV